MSLFNVILACNHIWPLESFCACNAVLRFKQHPLASAFHDMVLVTTTEGRLYEGLQKKICVFVGGEMSKEDRVLGGVSVFPTSKLIDNLLVSLKMVKWIGLWNIAISEHIESLSQPGDFQRY